jgi:folate-binding protein YgfZ
MVERDLPQETSQMRALNFNKGCYLGQEIVERIRSRGNVHRHLRHLELEGPLPPGAAELILEAGSEARSKGGTVAGQIRSAAELALVSGNRNFALGMIRGEAELRNETFKYTAGTTTGTARILTSPPSFE